MARKTTNKKLGVKKNKKSYDTKIIKWIAGGLAAFVAIVVAIVVILTYTKSYVAKVDGLKIYDHEYTYFLQNAVYTEQQENFEEPEGYDDMTDSEKYEVFKAFWTEDRKNKCIEDALEDARQFKAQYRLAVDAGFKISGDREDEIKDNIDSTYTTYLNSGISKEQITSYLFAGMSRSDYKDFVIMQATVESYKDELKKAYDTSDEVLRAIYDEKPDEYRTVGVRSFKIDIDEKKPTGENEDMSKYEAAKEAALKKAEEIRDTYNSGKLMSTYKDEDKTEIDQKNLTFENYIKAASDDDNSSKTGGLEQINELNKSAVDEITEYALSMQWNEDRTKIVKTGETAEDGAKSTDSEDKDEEDKAGNDEDADEDADEGEDTEEASVMTDLEIIETDDAIYVVRAESITDFDNSTESSEGAADSIKDKIKTQYLADKAKEEIEQKVNDSGSKYNLGSRKEDLISDLSSEVFQDYGI